MNRMTIIFLILGAVFLILAIVLIFSSERTKTVKTYLLPDDYAYTLNETYLTTGNILLTIKKLKEIYEEDTVLVERIERAMDYLQGEYGDYETAFSMLNEQEDEKIERLHLEIIRLEIAKTMGLPG